MFEFKLSFKFKHYVFGLKLMFKKKFKGKFEGKILRRVFKAKV
jgi:hypothetical protein